MIETEGGSAFSFGATGAPKIIGWTMEHLGYAPRKKL